MQSPEHPQESQPPKSVNALLRLVPLGFAIGSIGAGYSGKGTPSIFLGIAAVVALVAILAYQAKPLRAGLVASLAGAGVGAFLSFFGSAAEKACGSGTFANCGKILHSDWGHIGGVPTSLLACAFYAGLAIALWSAIKSNRKAEGAVLLLLAGVFATLFSAFLAYQSKVVEGEWCTFCISLYAVALLCLGAGLTAVKQHGSTSLISALTADSGKLVGPGLVVSLLLIGVGGSKAHTDSPIDLNPDQFSSPDQYAELYSMAKAPIRISGREPAKGSVKADWTLVEFTDYSCGHCAEQAPAIQALIKAHPKTRLLHKHYAFIREASTLAALSATCAHQQGRFWEMNEILFDNMKDWTRDDLDFVAKEMLKLDEEAFSSCMEDPATAKSIEADYDVGEQAGVRATPSIFLSFDGDTWLKMEAGPEGADLLLKAAEQGIPLPGLSPVGSGSDEAAP